MEVFAEDIVVTDVLREIEDTAQALMTRNDNTLKVELGSDLGVIHQDVTKLRQATLNLLSNAAKFTRKGLITLSVSRRKESAGDWLRIDVSDTGIGIPADRLESVFEEFTQAEVSTSSDYGGTGLGLPISRRFCQMLGGDLTIASEPGVGSIFTIELPVTMPEALQEDETVEPELIASAQSLPEGTYVLAIDDDPEALELIRRVLDKEQIEVVSVTGASEGLQLARERRPALITLDVVMSDMDGWRALELCKADPLLQDIPVVMLTIVDDQARATALGASDYLTKPVDRDRLVALVRQYYTAAQPR
jgi:CheY-like chemotaxis protein/anti-sigma regulatory factor (Ser/Thr protein kinase)